MFFKKKRPNINLLYKNKKTIILISLTIILFISLIITNLNFLTGKIIYKDKPMEEGIAQEPVIKEPTTILEISPDPVKNGEYMTITLTVGKTGADEIVEIRTIDDKRVVENLNMGCNGPTCFDEKIIKIYKSSTAWKGTYKVIAKDDATSPPTEVTTTFEVI